MNLQIALSIAFTAVVRVVAIYGVETKSSLRSGAIRIGSLSLLIGMPNSYADCDHKGIFS